MPENVTTSWQMSLSIEPGGRQTGSRVFCGVPLAPPPGTEVEGLQTIHVENAGEATPGAARHPALAWRRGVRRPGARGRSHAGHGYRTLRAAEHPDPEGAASAAQAFQC